MTPSNIRSNKEYALNYNKERFSVFPVKSDPPEDRKKPAVESTDEFMKKRADEQQIEQWFKENPNYNIGLLLGEISGNAFTFDTDGKGNMRMDEIIQSKASNDLKAAFDNTMVNTTSTGNKHYVFRLEGGPGALPNINRKDLWVEPNVKHSEIKLLINRSYIIAAPSVGEYDKSYTWNGKVPQVINRKLFVEAVQLINPTINLYGQNTDDTTTTTGYRDNNKNKSNKSTLDSISIAEGRLIRTLGDCYSVGSRQDWWLAISGVFRRNGIPLYDALECCRKICGKMSEDELNKRLDLMEQTYTKKTVVEVAGWRWLEDFIKVRNPDIDDKEKKIKQKKDQIQAAIFELKLEVIKRDNPWVKMNDNPETYLIVRRSENEFDIAETYRQPVRVKRVQLLEIKRLKVNVGGNIDNAGRGDIIDLNFDEILIDAVPCAKMQIVEDPVFGGTKYRVSWEYVDKTTNEIKHKSDRADQEPLRTIEEIEKYLKSQTTWVRKTQRLREVVGSVIDAYIAKGDNLVTYIREPEPSGFFYYDGRIWENKLGLTAKDDYKDEELQLQVLRETGPIAAETIMDMQKRFYDGANGRDKVRFAHYTKFHLVAPFDYARKQLKIIDLWSWIPRSDMNGATRAGKTDKGEIGCKMYGLDPNVFIISKRSFRSEPRLIELIGETTMPITLEEPDFLSKLDKPGVEDIVSTMKDTVTKMGAFRMQADHSKIYEHFLAPILLAHNSAAIMEEGAGKRFLNDEYEEVDIKENLFDPESLKRVQEYKTYLIQNKEKIKAIGIFVSTCVRKYPKILEGYWHDSAWRILRLMWWYYSFANKNKSQDGSGFTIELPPEWLKAHLLSAEAAAVGLSSAQSGGDVIENYRVQLLTAIQYFINDEFTKHSRVFEKEEGMLAEMVGIDKRLQWLATTDRLPGIFVDINENAVYFTAGIKQTLVGKYHVDERAFPSLSRFASFLGLSFPKTPKKLQYLAGKSKSMRVAYIEIPKLTRQFGNQRYSDTPTTIA